MYEMDLQKESCIILNHVTRTFRIEAVNTSVWIPDAHDYIKLPVTHGVEL